MTNRKPLSRRAMTGIKAKTHSFAQVAHWKKLSELLDATANHNICFPDAKIDQIFLCGSLEEMTREWCEEPLSGEWEFALPFVFKHRAPVYRYKGLDVQIAVKLVSHRESWFPDCEDQVVACEAWKALKAEWEAETSIPLLSTPSKTGQALLWENLPKGQSFPALPGDVEKIIRANSTQHRIEVFNNAGHFDWFKAGADESKLYQYDGRWMYAALCSLDRLPIGEPRRTGAFVPYESSWHHIAIKIPDSWKHIGLIPILDERLGWHWPCAAGSILRGWVSEPELTLALQNGWEIVEHFDGYAFDKGRPLEAWAKKLIRMREVFKSGERARALELGAFYKPERCAGHFASAAVRQILNHTIGSFHSRGFEREEFVSDDNFRQWRRENAHLLELRNVYRVEGGYMVPTWVPDNSPLSINMPHWSAAIWALERARVAQWALRCDPSTIVKINGDAIYLTAPAPWEGEDNGNLGQLRRKA